MYCATVLKVDRRDCNNSVSTVAQLFERQNDTPLNPTTEINVYIKLLKSDGDKRCAISHKVRGSQRPRRRHGAIFTSWLINKLFVRGLEHSSHSWKTAASELPILSILGLSSYAIGVNTFAFGGAHHCRLSPLPNSRGCTLCSMVIRVQPLVSTRPVWGGPPSYPIFP